MGLSETRRDSHGLARELCACTDKNCIAHASRGHNARAMGTRCGSKLVARAQFR
jgi:hypothetical protein